MDKLNFFDDFKAVFGNYGNIKLRNFSVTPVESWMFDVINNKRAGTNSVSAAMLGLSGTHRYGISCLLGRC